MLRKSIERRLRGVHAQLVRAREELAVLREQLAVASEMADDTNVQALVSDEPMATKEHNEASRQVAALMRSEDALLDTITQLERRQDDLLDRLVVNPG